MTRSALLATLLALSACAATPAPPPTATPQTSSQAPQRDFDPDAPPRIETATFALELTAPSSSSTGQPAPISITIERRGDFHINLEYPLRVELGASHGAAIAKSTLAATDARELNEERARLETQARWNASGRHWLAARVHFAVCTPDTCVPRSETLAVHIDVP
jgi:hypothetical protein